VRGEGSKRGEKNMALWGWGRRERGGKEWGGGGWKVSRTEGKKKVKLH